MAAPFWSASPVPHTGGVLHRPVRVLLPRPAAGHPWPAVRIPPVRGTGRGVLLLRVEDQERARSRSRSWQWRGVAVPLDPVTIRPVATSASTLPPSTTAQKVRARRGG